MPKRFFAMKLNNNLDCRYTQSQCYGIWYAAIKTVLKRYIKNSIHMQQLLQL